MTTKQALNSLLLAASLVACGDDASTEATPAPSELVDAAVEDSADFSQRDAATFDARASADASPAPEAGPACDAGTDFANDVANCGSCGHRCVASGANTVAACVAGSCRAITTLATGQTWAADIAVNDTAVVWTQGNVPGTVASVSKSGGNVVVLASGQNAPSGLWLSSRRAAWSALDSADPVWQVDLLSTSPSIVTSNAFAYAVTGDDNYAYWIGSSHTISRVHWDGSGRSDLATNQYSSGNILASDSANLYFAAGLNIRRLWKSGGAPVNLATLATSEVYGLAVDDTHVYWTNDTKLLAVPKAGGATQVLVSGQLLLWQLAVDATSVYFVEGSRLKKIDKQGTTAVQLAPIAGVNIGGVAVDATYVYWTDYTNGMVLRTTK